MTDLESIELQRGLTRELIKKRRLNVQAIWYKPGTQISESDTKLDTDVDLWTSAHPSNLGVRLADDHIELRIHADHAYQQCLFAAFAHLRIDARASYGAHSVTSIILAVGDSIADIERWRTLWPKGHKGVRTELNYSLMPTRKAGKPVYAYSAPLPGSVVDGKVVLWRPAGKPATQTIELGIEDFEPRQLAPTILPALIRAIAWATLAYHIRIYLEGLTSWDEILIRTIGGWLARAVREGQDINAKGKVLEGACWASLDSEELALDLMLFLGKPSGLEQAFLRAARELEINPLAPVPSWPALGTVLSLDAKAAIRRAFHAGLDIEMVEQLAERYVFDMAEGNWIDLKAIIQGIKYRYSYEELIRIYANETVFINKKPLNPFYLLAGSKLRSDVNVSEFMPGHKPVSIIRKSRINGFLNGEKYPDEYSAFNIFPGFPYPPASPIDPVIMGQALSMLDELLGLVTRNHRGRMMWLKKWIAWTLQHPDKKQQSCPLLIGGQGIGKSVLGEQLIQSLFGGLAGSANARSLGENSFFITPFVGKLVTFIDEIYLEGNSTINQLKKIVRNVHVPGEEKYKDPRGYEIWSRVMLASNHVEIGLKPEDAADRTMFIILGWTAENRHLSDFDFKDWTVSLKPFFNSFITALDDRPFKQHLVRHFLDIECTCEELEDLTLSCHRDEVVITATMSREREVARLIIADARVLTFKDIKSWFNLINLREAIKRHDGQFTKLSPGRVMHEFDRAGVIESMLGGWFRFKYGYQKLLSVMGEAHGFPIVPEFPFQSGDDDDNDVSGPHWGPDWRGKLNRSGFPAQFSRDRYEPEYD